jgi:hypothetical protein
LRVLTAASQEKFRPQSFELDFGANIDDDVLHQFQGPQGREVVEPSHVYTILALLPLGADGRPRYRIKSKDENFERVVAEDLLSRFN